MDYWNGLLNHPCLILAGLCDNGTMIEIRDDVVDQILADATALGRAAQLGAAVAKALAQERGHG